MSTLTITRGLPGSGKSQWAQDHAAAMGNTLIIERDMLRMELFGTYWTGNQDDEQLVTKMQEDRVRYGLRAGADVIVSDTNLPDRAVRRWLAVAHEEGAGAHVKDFRSLPLETVLARNADRAKTVPAEVITDKHGRFIKGKDLFKPVVFTPPPTPVFEPYVPKRGALPAYLIDIDGTVAITGDRDVYDGSKAHLDTVNEHVAHVVQHLAEIGYAMVYMSGRSNDHRDVTEQWLADNRFRVDELHMRASGDSRKDSIVKHELFNQHVRDKYDVLGVFDDRNQVVEMWRAIGLTVFHVADGNF